jgi:hypothetical protein
MWGYTSPRPSAQGRTASRIRCTAAAHASPDKPRGKTQPSPGSRPATAAPPRYGIGGTATTARAHRAVMPISSAARMPADLCRWRRSRRQRNAA